MSRALISNAAIAIAAFGTSSALAQDRAFNCSVEWRELSGSKDRTALRSFTAKCRGTPAAVAAADRLSKLDPPSPAQPSAKPKSLKPVARNKTAEELSYEQLLANYNAGRYAVVQQEAKVLVSQYGYDSRYWSGFQHLLGLSYLADGKPASASVAFYDNYHRSPHGMKTKDSLLSLGFALTRLGKKADACKVFTEFSEVYGNQASTKQKRQLGQGQHGAECDTY